MAGGNPGIFVLSVAKIGEQYTKVHKIIIHAIIFFTVVKFI